MVQEKYSQSSLKKKPERHNRRPSFSAGQSGLSMPKRSHPYTMRAPSRGSQAKNNARSSLSWTHEGTLFAPISPAQKEKLSQFLTLLRAVRPLQKEHRNALPGDIVTLSENLTTERSRLSHPYWSKPAAISAYLYYFLPWNLVRLIRLFQTLPLQP